MLTRRDVLKAGAATAAALLPAGCPVGRNKLLLGEDRRDWRADMMAEMDQKIIADIQNSLPPVPAHFDEGWWRPPHDSCILLGCTEIWIQRVRDNQLILGFGAVAVPLDAATWANYRQAYEGTNRAELTGCVRGQSDVAYQLKNVRLVDWLFNPYKLLMVNVTMTAELVHAGPSWVGTVEALKAAP